MKLTCDDTRYSQPALRTSRLSSSVVTRKKALSVMISKAMRKRMASRAMTITDIAPASSPRNMRTRDALSGCDRCDQYPKPYIPTSAGISETGKRNAALSPSTATENRPHGRVHARLMPGGRGAPIEATAATMPSIDPNPRTITPTRSARSGLPRKIHAANPLDAMSAADRSAQPAGPAKPNQCSGSDSSIRQSPFGPPLSRRSACSIASSSRSGDRRPAMAARTAWS